MIYISGIDYISIIPYFTPDIVAHTEYPKKCKNFRFNVKKQYNYKTLIYLNS